MSNVDVWQWIVAILTPYIVSLVNRPTWSRTTKRLVMVGVSILVAFGTAWVEGDFADWNWSQFSVFLAAFVGIVQVAYSAFEAAGPTNWLLDQTEMMLTKVTTPQAVQAKEATNSQAVEEFKDNLAIK